MLLRCRCIDGYSRRIMWLKCAYSNHSPQLIASYFVECTSAIGGFPSTVRTDCGTENVLLAAIQVWSTGNNQGHLYGTSPSNQRIESWWSFFRRCHSQGSIDFFESMVADGLYQRGNVRQTECIRFCFMGLLQENLDRIALEWNTHRIRPSPGARCPAGIPDALYFLPPASAQNCITAALGPLPPELVQQLQPSRPCEDESLLQYMLYLCQFHGWTAPTSADDAKQLYQNIMHFL